MMMIPSDNRSNQPRPEIRASPDPSSVVVPSVNLPCVGFPCIISPVSVSPVSFPLHQLTQCQSPLRRFPLRRFPQCQTPLRRSFPLRRIPCIFSPASVFPVSVSPASCLPSVVHPELVNSCSQCLSPPHLWQCLTEDTSLKRATLEFILLTSTERQSSQIVVDASQRSDDW